MSSVFSSLFKRKRSVSLAAADSAPVSQESDRSNKKSTIPSPKLNADEKSLRRAIINLDLASVKKIIDKAPTLANIPVNDSGQTALHLAAELGSSELLTYLLSKDSDPNIEDEAGLTPLHLVNSSQAFSLILKSKNMNLQKKTGNADTILHHFARRFPLLDEDILKYMRKNGVDLNAVNGVGDAALHIATSNDHYKLAALLLENGAWPNVQNRRGETPLYIASQSANGRMVKLLIKFSANAALEANDELSPLDVAATEEIREMLRPLTRLSSKTDLGKRTVASSGPKAIASPGRSALTVTFPSNNHADHNTFGYDSEFSVPIARSLPARSDAVRSMGGSPHKDLRSRSFSFTQSFNRLAIMDEELGARPIVSDTDRSQMKEKIEVELLDELEHLIDADFLVEVIQKVTESRSFAWSEDLDSTKIEILQWIADFLSEEQSQAYLQFLYTNYGKKIPIEVVEFKLKTKEKKKMGRAKSVSKFNLKDRKIKAYDWEIDGSELQSAGPIGNGSYGVVHKAVMAGQDVAVKKINSDQVEGDVLLKEIAMLSKLSHPSIIKFLGACLQENVALVMEYAANGDLKSFLKRGRLDWATKVSIARQIADGMNYLHSQNPSIVHRDLKCQNILVTGDGRVKVSDFGLSRSMTNGAESSRLGTLNWLAPEVLRGGTFSSAADVYAMGMCMYEILMDGEPPYNDWLPLQIVRAIDEGEHPQIPRDCDASYADIMQRCWGEPESRPSFQEIVNILSVEEKRLMSRRTSSSSLADGHKSPKSPRHARASSAEYEKGASSPSSPRSANTSPRMGSSSPRSGSFDGKNSVIDSSYSKKKRSSDKEKRTERRVSEKSIDVTISGDSPRKRGSTDKLVSFGN